MSEPVQIYASMYLPRAHTDALHLLIEELIEARDRHGDYRGPHEGWAVIREEVDELWDEVKRRSHDRAAMRREAIQIACTAIRFAAEVCAVEDPV